MVKAPAVALLTLPSLPREEEQPACHSDRLDLMASLYTFFPATFLSTRCVQALPLGSAESVLLKLRPGPKLTPTRCSYRAHPMGLEPE